MAIPGLHDPCPGSRPRVRPAAQPRALASRGAAGSDQKGGAQRGSGPHWDLTESRSSMTRWGLDAEEGLVPLSLLNCVNRMFMVARSTSERLCLICTERDVEVREEPTQGPGQPWSHHPPTAAGRGGGASATKSR